MNLIFFYDKAAHLIDLGKLLSFFYFIFNKAFSNVFPSTLLDEIAGIQLDEDII